MTAVKHPTGFIHGWTSTRPVGRTAHGLRGGIRLDMQIDHDQDLLPLQLPDPDGTDLPVASEYARYVAKHLDLPTEELLDRLSDEYGLMWLSIARVAQVSVPGLRKWRQGGSPTLPKKLALARLLSACEQLTEIGVPDVASWLNTPIRLDQNRLRLELLTLDEGGRTLIALAQDTISPSQALDDLDPAWRERHATPTTEVTVSPDGYGTVHVAEA